MFVYDELTLGCCSTAINVSLLLINLDICFALFLILD